LGYIAVYQGDQMRRARSGKVFEMVYVVPQEGF
jgi:hypothetical protein